MLLTGIAHAQDDFDSLTTVNPTDGKPTTFTLAAGVTAGGLLYSLDPLNQVFAAPFTPQRFKGFAFTRDIQVLTTIPGINNVRFAPQLGWASQSAETFDTVIAGQGVRRSLSLSATHYGLGADYLFWSEEGSYGFAPGIAVAYGRLDIQAQQGSEQSTFSISKDFDTSTTSIAHDYYTRFFTVRPQVQFEWEPIHYVMLRAYAGYQFMGTGTWYADDDIKLGTAPELENVSMSGFTAGIGLFFGFFF
jgi:hypothetical protein